MSWKEATLDSNLQALPVECLQLRLKLISVDLVGALVLQIHSIRRQLVTCQGKNKMDCMINLNHYTANPFIPSINIH